MNQSHILLTQHLQELGIKHQPEFKFHPSRKWRIDFLLPELNTALEIEGGIWTRGRHLTSTGFIKDMEKYNEIARAGYRLIRFATEDVMTGKAKEFLKGYR